MLKTATPGTTSITNVKKYLEKERRQEHGLHAEELTLFKEGQLQLSESQVGQLERYLKGNSRALAVDVSKDLTKRNWAREMDLTRARYRHDQQTKRGTPRTYYHFILSPGIDDDCGFEAFRSYAGAWAEENFRTGGKLHQYAIVYHDDNAKGVLHAHIIVNVTNKATGKKLHINNKEVVRLGNSAQEIGKRFGLSPIRPDNEYKHVGVRTRQPIYMTRGERELLNKGQYSWKWELRKVIADIAPLSSSYDDFKRRMNQAGYDVAKAEKRVVDEDAGRDEEGRPIYKLGYEYLTYTHPNGKKVRDSKLGARFYPEELEKDFVHERVLEDRSYAPWELIKISKGQVPWKEEIRRAIDAVAPNVMSIPELGDELNRLFGIRLIVNRRGITYQHACGYKTRDTGIGLRYTPEGLRQNAIVAESPLPYPDCDAIMEGSAKLAKHYLPRSTHGVEGDAHEKAAAHLIYRELTDLMLRSKVTRIEDVGMMLEERQKTLREKKSDLVKMKGELMRWNHLSALQSLYEKNRAFLQREGREAEPILYNDVLIRTERIGLYLREQAGKESIKTRKKELSEAYEGLLSHYQEQLNELSQDQAIYQNFMLMKGMHPITEEVGYHMTVDVQSLFAAGKTLTNHRIRNFFHLSQSISQGETRLDLANHRLEKAQARKTELDLIQAYIRAYEESKSYLPLSGTLAKRPSSLGVESHQLLFRDAAARLAAAGVDEAGFETQHELWQEAERECQELTRERDKIQAYVDELREAQAVCQGIAESLRSPFERVAGEGKKSGASGSFAISATKSKQGSQPCNEASIIQEADFDEIPIREANRRRLERMSQSPERSRRQSGDLAL